MYSTYYAKLMDKYISETTQNIKTSKTQFQVIFSFTTRATLLTMQKCRKRPVGLNVEHTSHLLLPNHQFYGFQPFFISLVSTNEQGLNRISTCPVIWFVWHYTQKIIQRMEEYISRYHFIINFQSEMKQMIDLNFTKYILYY